MTDVKQIFNKQTINFLKQNKHEITEELLDLLREDSKKGKQIALDILDLPQDNEYYYLDAFGNRMSFNGNRRLKKGYSKLALSPIHKAEIIKCANDIHYFKENYVKIVTPKGGINFPDMRQYQDDFLDIILPDENDAIVSLQPRQSGKTVTIGVYLAHCFLFKREMNIGIAANKAKQAGEFLDKTKKILIEIPIWMQSGIQSWNKTYIENENGMRIITDSTSSDSFRGFTCAIVVVDETAFVRPTLWEEFADSIFPSQSGLAWTKNILISTANGLNHFYDLINGAREETNGYVPFEVNWKDVPRYNPDGSLIPNEEFQRKIIAKHGIVYFNQNYGNEFLGSSHTLITTEKLKLMKSKEPEELRDGKLKIFEYPEENHKYIMAIDAAKDGTDAFGIQIIDITDFKFKQVASAELQIDYLLMPEFIYEWCEWYNFPYLIIENNEGAGQSIADQMYQSYEYENLHFDNKDNTNQKNRVKSRKSYPGFRTTVKTRRQILQTLKLFIENDNLEINDKRTINQFFTFILKNNKKYEADEGCKDDMIMSLAIVFAPFCNTKNFEDMKKMVSAMYNNDTEKENSASFSEMLTIASFDSGTDDDFDEIHTTDKPKEYLSMEEYLADQEGFF